MCYININYTTCKIILNKNFVLFRTTLSHKNATNLKIPKRINTVEIQEKAHESSEKRNPG